MKKAVAYCRFSSDNQRTESIDAQVRAIEEYCRKEGYTLIKIYKDEAISGTSIDDREEFLKMIEDSKNKEFNYVIVHKFDRFARNRYDHAINEKAKWKWSKTYICLRAIKWFSRGSYS